MGMDLAPDAPNAPSYDPMLQASLQTYNTDLAAYENLNATSTAQREFGAGLAGASAEQSQFYRNMATDAMAWGRNQFNNIWPYALQYLTSQQSLSTLAGENATEAMIAGREARDRATTAYNQYQTEFAPIASRFAKEVTDYADPANAQRMAARARTDVRTAAEAADARREAEMRSYNLDPSQAAYQGADELAAVQTAAAEAGAGTNAYENQRMGALDLLGKAAQFGLALPSQAMQWLQSAASGVQSALGTAGQIGGQAIAGASNLLNAGTTAGGSPASYAYVSGNPYTTLSGQQTQAGSSALGYGTNLLTTGIPNLIGSATGAQKAGFEGEMASFAGSQKAENEAWGGLMKGLGGIGSALMTPMSTIKSSVGASLLGGIFSDRRLKEDIRYIGKVGALPMYSFRYKGSPVRQVGYMADEVEDIDPSAVMMHPSGFKAVDYARATISALGA